MYWTDVATDRIERATMDGNFRTVLHSTGLNVVFGITLDFDNQILYWVDYTNNRIEKSFVNGSGRAVVSNGLRDPWAVTYYGGILYWTDLYFDRVYSFSVSSSPASILQVTPYLGTDPRDIRVTREDRQPLGLLLD